MKPTVAALASALAVLALLGCGEDDDSERASPAATTTSVSEPAIGATGETGGTTTPTIEDDTGLPEERCEGAESPPNIINVISYGTDCGAVEAAMAEIGSVSRTFRIGDFDCSRRSGTALGGVWECRGEASYFTFEFGD